MASECPCKGHAVDGDGGALPRHDDSEAHNYRVPRRDLPSKQGEHNHCVGSQCRYDSERNDRSANTRPIRRGWQTCMSTERPRCGKLRRHEERRAQTDDDPSPMTRGITTQTCAGFAETPAALASKRHARIPTQIAAQMAIGTCWVCCARRCQNEIDVPRESSFLNSGQKAAKPRLPDTRPDGARAARIWLHSRRTHSDSHDTAIGSAMRARSPDTTPG